MGTGGTALLLLAWNTCLLSPSADLFLSREQSRLGLETDVLVLVLSFGQLLCSCSKQTESLCYLP